MLQQERQKRILDLLEQNKTIEITDVMELLGISESTARRDITALDREGKLKKVFGGAVPVSTTVYISDEPSVAQKKDLNVEAKKRIAKYAAEMIQEGDFIYLDAGTTTGYMIDYISAKNIHIVTNAVAHAQKLAAGGYAVILVGGSLKTTTEAVVGNQALLFLQQYHFTKGFFGSNAISRSAGLTTHDPNEALVKKVAVEQCGRAFVLVDSSKFGTIAPVTFAGLNQVTLISEEIPERYREYDVIRV